MKKRRWVLLGSNLLLAAAILVQPAQATSPSSETCMYECVQAWAECVFDGFDIGPHRYCDEEFYQCMWDCWPD